MNQWLVKEQQKQALLKRYGYDMARSHDFILEKSSLSQGSLLEIGTGKGHFTRLLAKKNISFVTIDLDVSAQKIAKEYLALDHRQKKVCVRVMNAEKLKFGNLYFDTVVSVNFMHHAQKPFLCLKEMVRVVRRKIVIADVNCQGAKILERFHAGEGHRHPRSRVSFGEMREFLQKKGFAVKIYRGFCQTILVSEKGEKK